MDITDLVTAYKAPEPETQRTGIRLCNLIFQLGHITSAATREQVALHMGFLVGRAQDVCQLENGFLFLLNSVNG